MATIPTPEQSGRKILKIYSDYNVRSGQMLQYQNINSHWIKMGESEQDLQPGLKWLLEQGHLEKKKGRPDAALFLTEKGFAEM